MARAKKVTTESVSAADNSADITVQETTASTRVDGISAMLAGPYGAAADNDRLAQFAIGLMRDGSGAFDHDDAALRNRMKDAFKRAKVMLEEFKNATGA